MDANAATANTACVDEALRPGRSRHWDSNSRRRATKIATVASTKAHQWSPAIISGHGIKAATTNKAINRRFIRAAPLRQHFRKFDQIAERIGKEGQLAADGGQHKRLGHDWD